MPAIAVRDTTIYYEQAGQGPALLFIHGMCGDARVWAGQAGRLAGRFSCVSFDRRGHTRSAPGTEPESVATHAADAAALIEALELARPWWSAPPAAPASPSSWPAPVPACSPGRCSPSRPSSPWTPPPGRRS